MSVNYNDYLAAVERLRQLDLTDNDDKCKLIYGSTCYLPTNPAVRADKVLIYDAEHDREPASVEWLEGIGGKRIDAVGNTLVKFCEFITVWKVDSGLLLTMHGMEMLTNPTRGDVLTALRLFKKEGA